MTHKDWKIAVVGAGIGGLTLALALRQRGIEVDLYEQTAELREVGAAVALSANAIPEDIQRALRAGIREYWTKPLDFKGFMTGLDRLFGGVP